MQFEMPLFAILDTKSECFFPPICAHNVADGLRIFGDLLTNPQSTLSKHPGDYRLYRVGVFHVDTGVVSGLDMGVQLVEDGLLLVKEV